MLKPQKNGKGINFRESGEYEKVDKAIELNPSDAGTYANRGVAYTGLGQFDIAFEDFDKAVELDPNLPLAYEHRDIPGFEIEFAIAGLLAIAYPLIRRK